MRPTFRKLEVKDIGNLERLVAENVEGIEPGLKIVDSRLLLGQAAIDLVGLDATGSLVLIALDFSADEGLLLRVMDAYSWCLEYPDTIRRLYPMAQVLTSRPPRILFIAERLTDSFLRRIKQLSFLEIDCLEFRHLEVNGASIVYFDLVERLRKVAVESTVETPAPAPVSIAPAVAATVAPRFEPAKPVVAEPVPIAPYKAAVVEPVRFIVELEAAVAEPVRVELAKRAVVEPARPEPLIVGGPSAPAPVAEPAAVVELAPPAMQEHQSVKVADELPVPAPPAPEVVFAEPISAPPALKLQAIETTASLAAVDSGAHGSATASGSVFERPAVEPAVDERAVAATPEIAVPVSAPAAQAVPVDAPAVVVTPEAPAALEMPAAPQRIAAAPLQTPPVWAKPQAQPNGGRPYFFAQATKGTTPVEAAAAAVTAPVQPPAPPVASKVALEVDDRPELESLSFPKDGLSRQWLEFLSQLGATK